MHYRHTSFASVALFSVVGLSTPIDSAGAALRLLLMNPIEWGAIGDSWASGVTAKPADDYKAGVNDPCLITNYAYAAQLEKNMTW